MGGQSGEESHVCACTLRPSPTETRPADANVRGLGRAKHFSSRCHNANVGRFYGGLRRRSEDSSIYHGSKMPMPRSLSKVQKHVSKKRGGKPNALHENSRDAQRLRRAGAREDKLTKILNAATRSNQNYGMASQHFNVSIL